MSKNDCREKLCASWSSAAAMITARTNFAADSGPDKDATGTAQGVDNDPRVYAIGGLDILGSPLASAEKYNPNDNTWTSIEPLPTPLGNCSGTFVPDYGAAEAINLGYIYVLGDNNPNIYRYNIKQDFWETIPVPFNVSNATLVYLDDVGGPLAQLLILTAGAEFPACSDGQTLWVVGGDGTEQQTWYSQSNINGELVGEWFRGPDLPLKRFNPVIGRVFWRDAGITSFGISNCASIVVCGGNDGTKDTRDIQLLVRKDCDWAWIDKSNNTTGIPDDVLTLAVPVSSGSFGTEQWPETLVTGGRAIVFGGNPAIDNSASTQFAQLRFIEGRFQRDPCLQPGPPNSAWNQTASMPGARTNFRACPLSQENSSIFGGRRVSRFLCIGGIKQSDNAVTDRAQLFQLPVPSAFVLLSQDKNRCRCDKKHNKKYKKHCWKCNDCWHSCRHSK